MHLRLSHIYRRYLSGLESESSIRRLGGVCCRRLGIVISLWWGRWSKMYVLHMSTWMLVPYRLISIFSAHRRKPFAGMSDIRHGTLLQVQCMQLDCDTCSRTATARTIDWLADWEFLQVCGYSCQRWRDNRTVLVWLRGSLSLRRPEEVIGSVHSKR